MSTMQTKPQIKLEPAEQQLTDLLREAAAKKAFSDPDVEIRYAGGWVRDKIIGKPSHDIDIAISTVSGHEFAVQLSEFMKVNHPELKTRSVNKIQANPEKSKHLDTATSTFMDLSLDFVQLRTESYATPDSRTPSFVGVGTLEEDAARRDCTMNALYYNVHSLEVEDPTGKGLHDLAHGVLQTPLPPRQTFLDDPLRILRCIRFASQFGFSISESTYAEMKNDEVRQALKDKVVKERIGIEVYKMMRGIDPAKAIRAMYEQELYRIVFEDKDPEAYPPWFDFAVVERAIAAARSSDLQRVLAEYLDGRLWLLIALLPYRERESRLAKIKRPDVTTEPVSAVMIRDSLKLTHTLEVLVKSVFPPRQIAVNVETSNLDLGKYIRALEKDWKLVIFVAHQHDDIPVSKTVELIDRIESAGLGNAWAMKSFIDGKKIKGVLQEAQANIKVMRELTELVVEYQIENPSITEEEGLDRLREYLKHRQPNAEGW